MSPPLADGAGSPLDQGVATLLFLLAAILGWIAQARLRRKSYLGLPMGAVWAAAGVALVSLVLAFVLPPIIRPNVASARPSSAARLSVLSPAPGEDFTGEPATVPVRLGLAGARIVPFTSSKLARNEGHIHLYLDGSLVSMTFSLSADLQVAPGSHVLRAEFVAVDHAPFHPRVQVSVPFTVTA